jgi:hypothetical protein
MVSGVLHEDVESRFIYGAVDSISGTMNDIWSRGCDEWYKGSYTGLWVC